MTSNGSNDAFVARHDANGMAQWSRSFGGAKKDRAVDVDVTKTAGMVVTGSQETPFDFGPTTLSDRIFIARLDAAGMPLLARSFDAAEVGDAALHSNGSVAVAIKSFNSFPIDGYNLISASGFLIVMLDPALKLKWWKGFRGPSEVFDKFSSDELRFVDGGLVVVGRGTGELSGCEIDIKIRSTAFCRPHGAAVSIRARFRRASG